MFNNPPKSRRKTKTRAPPIIDNGNSNDILKQLGITKHGLMRVFEQKFKINEQKYELNSFEDIDIDDMGPESWQEIKMNKTFAIYWDNFNNRWRKGLIEMKSNKVDPEPIGWEHVADSRSFAEIYDKNNGIWKSGTVNSEIAAWEKLITAKGFEKVDPLQKLARERETRYGYTHWGKKFALPAYDRGVINEYFKYRATNPDAMHPTF